MAVYEVGGEGAYGNVSHSFSAYSDTSLTIKEFVNKSMILHFRLKLTSKENDIYSC
jgi:hypothetical protein